MMTDKGFTDKVKGKAKETLGKATDDSSLKAEGVVDQEMCIRDSLKSAVEAAQEGDILTAVADEILLTENITIPAEMCIRDRLKGIGKSAREDIEALVGTKVFLQLWVKVKENWRDSYFMLSNFGYKD